MLLLNTLFAFLAVASSVTGLNVPKASASGRVSEKLNGPPAGWTVDVSTSIDKETSRMKLRVQLVPQDMKKFQKLAIDIATPGHASYGKHLSQHVIDAMIAPKDEASKLVMEWIESEGLGNYASLSPRLDAVVIEASIGEIEELLNAKYETFGRAYSVTKAVNIAKSSPQLVHATTGDIQVRTLEYSIPENLQDHVKTVQPTTFFGLRAIRSTISKVGPLDKNPDAVNAGVTPKFLQSLYNFGSATCISAGKMGIAGFLKQWPSALDLSAFLQSYAIQDNSDQTYSCTIINGGTCPLNGGGNIGVEANLDIQYARAITESIPNVFYSTGGSPPIVGGGTNQNEPYLEFLNYLLALDDTDLPNTLSISYGDDEDTVPFHYADCTCNLFSQLGTRGVSILVASGDSGVGDACSIGGKTVFTTLYPASCPWVTTVGGTSGINPESAWADGGGGFSSVFGRPSYQADVVSSWLANDQTHCGVTQYFNSSGRAYPDVAAQASKFTFVVDGSEKVGGGTSCSTPTFASVIQLINSNRIAVGKAGLGFLNPWLYSSALSALNDITNGGNTGCSGVIPGAGFDAVTGWDPATGLGTPDYEKLLIISSST